MESFLTHAGYTALLIFGFLEACCVPISSEVTFGFAGILAYQGHLSLPLVIIVGSAGELLGSLTAYGVGRLGGRPLVDRVGRYVLISSKDIDRAERFFAGRGWWAVPVGRVLPFVRGFISIVAGVIRIPAPRFALLSLIGTVVYGTALAVIGYELGSAWTSVSRDVSYSGYVLFACLVLGLAGFVLLRWHQVRKEAAASAAAGAAPANPAPADPPPGRSPADHRTR